MQSQGCAWLSDCEVCGERKCVPHFSAATLDAYAERRAEGWAMELGLCSLIAHAAAGENLEEVDTESMVCACLWQNAALGRKHWACLTVCACRDGRWHHKLHSGDMSAACNSLSRDQSLFIVWQ